MWGTILYSATLSGWITCGVQYYIVVHHQGGLHVGYNTGGLHVGYNTGGLHVGYNTL